MGPRTSYTNDELDWLWDVAQMHRFGCPIVRGGRTDVQAWFEPGQLSYLNVCIAEARFGGTLDKHAAKQAIDMLYLRGFARLLGY